MGEIDVLFDIVAVKHALEINSLEKLDKLRKGEIAVVNLKLLYRGRASLEHLELKLVGDEVGLASLQNSLVEHLGNGDVNGIYAVNYRNIKVICGNLCNLTDFLVAAADDTREGELVRAVLGDYLEIVGKVHFIVGHLRNLGKSGDIL